MTSRAGISNSPSAQVLSRREVLRAAASAAVVAAAPAALAQQGAAAGRVFYYVDGYHGGVDGHMPPDSLRNVLDGLDKFPQWKVSFEIEPYSWAVFARSDAPSIERLKRFLADATPAGRVELVSGAYGQAYAWNASGECNVRQLAFGRAELRAVFPDVGVDTYAVQEPCWTSCLPQLLKSFGYRRTVLKNSTCWGGYHGPMVDADLVDWTGPDGTAIVAVPQYASERLVAPATTESARPPADFLDRCAAAGIKHPVGTTLQDMGWPGRPWRFGMGQEIVRAMRHVTWREYVDTVAGPGAAPKAWKASQDDVKVGLAWGASILQRIAQVVRAGENALLRAEKLASMALARRGSAYPVEELNQAWRHLLWSQHHDVWIVPYNRHRDGTWASATDAKAEMIQQTCARVLKDSVAAMAPGAAEERAKGQSVRVFNTTGFRRQDMATVELTTEQAGRPLRVLDGRGEVVPCQVAPTAGDASKSPSLLFRADVPAMGYTTYRIETVDPAPPRASGPTVSAATEADGTVRLESDLYTILIDPAKGGQIRSLYSKEMRREFVDSAGPRGFNEFRGYFGTQGEWLTSAAAPAEVRIIEEGPLRLTARIRGRIGAWPFTTDVTLAAGRRRIDFQTTFEFPVDSPPFGRGRRPGQPQSPQPPQPQQRFRVGETWEPGRDATRSSRRPFYDSSFKLQALFPAALRRPTLDKNAPFDVCRSAADDTRFNAWDTIRNNVVLNWVDLVEEGGEAGLAVMTDHATAYSRSPGEPLGLVMCYAGPGVWFDYGLGRTPRIAYSIVPHAGDWAKAQLWRELARWSEPLVVQPCGAPAADDREWSLIDASDGGLEVTAAYRDDEGRLVVRLFNAEGDAAPQRMKLDERVRRVELVELDGRVVKELPIKRGAGGGTVSVAMPRFGVRTLRCTTG